MKFILMSTDLEERDIKLTELSHGSDKTQRLFREIMQLVQSEGEFSEDNTPFLIEAMRIGADSLTIVVTKMDESDIARHGFIPDAHEHCRFKRAGLIKQGEYQNEDSHLVFSFNDLDTAAAAVATLQHVFEGNSQVYKMDVSGKPRYYLWMRNETEDDRTTADLDAILQEFGLKHISNALSWQYLVEHAEVIIAEDAVEKLSLYHANA